MESKTGEDVREDDGIDNLVVGLQAAHLEVSQDALDRLASKFVTDNEIRVDYGLPASSTIRGKVSVLFAFMCPSDPAIEARTNGQFWHSFKNNKNNWLRTIEISNVVLKSVAERMESIAGMPTIDSLDDVFLMDLFFWRRWHTGISYTPDDKKRARDWLELNIDLIKPDAVVIFTATAAFNEEGDDFLGFASDADISTAEHTSFMSVRIHGAPYPVSVLVHPGRLRYCSGLKEREEYVKTMCGVFKLCAADRNALSQSAESTIVDSVMQIFETGASLAVFAKGFQEAQSCPKLFTLQDLQNLALQRGLLTVSDSTLRTAMAPYKTALKKGNTFLYSFV